MGVELWATLHGPRLPCQVNVFRKTYLFPIERKLPDQKSGSAFAAKDRARSAPR
jgi:hypothetical protein